MVLLISLLINSPSQSPLQTLLLLNRKVKSDINSSINKLPRNNLNISSLHNLIHPFNSFFINALFNLILRHKPTQSLFQKLTLVISMREINQNPPLTILILIILQHIFFLLNILLIFLFILGNFRQILVVFKELFFTNPRVKAINFIHNHFNVNFIAEIFSFDNYVLDSSS